MAAMRATAEAGRVLPVQGSGRTKVADKFARGAGTDCATLVSVRTRECRCRLWLALGGLGARLGEKRNGEPQETKKEDWFLIRGMATRPPSETTARAALAKHDHEPGDQAVPIAGWVIARFLELDVPEAVREGANAANLRPIAWFELNNVEDPRGGKGAIFVGGGREARKGSRAIFRCCACTPGIGKNRATKQRLLKIICAGDCRFELANRRPDSRNFAF